ncbi:MAG: hypothetical protein D3916_09615 [Candidatus Electrothrix sp. MAN1_4]|nr:hypothetical protein [Candidatus Electrothrix sp. MAN1_4]
MSTGTIMIAMNIAVDMNGMRMIVMRMTVMSIVAGMNGIMMTVMNIVEGMKDMNTETADLDDMTMIAITIEDTHMMIDRQATPYR